VLVEKCLEAIEPLTPKLLVVRYPARDFAQGSRVQPVESLATLLTTAHKPDVKQDRQMLGDGRIGEPDFADDRPNARLARRQNIKLRLMGAIITAIAKMSSWVLKVER
jgi:hypothetical protein